MPTIQVVLNDAVDKVVRDAAERCGLSVSSFIRRLVREAKCETIARCDDGQHVFSEVEAMPSRPALFERRKASGRKVDPASEG
jgi:hypothetical protein